MKKNRLILIIVLLVTGVVGVFTYIAKNDPNLNSESSSESSSEDVSFFDFGLTGNRPVVVDADEASDTLDNIARDSADLKARFRNYEEESADAERRFKQTEDLIAQLKSQNELQAEQLKAQNETIQEMQLEPKGFDIETIRDGLMSDIKTELEAFAPKNTDPIVVEPEEPVIDEGSTRVRSMNLPLDVRGNLTDTYLNEVRNTSSSPLASTGTGTGTAKAPVKPELVIDPRYTIFSDSILNDAITLTALNGRVPKQGDLNDPSPFKVMIGNENLAANGFRIPNLKGMMMSGIVYGDKVLSCVRTKIQRATYIFEDGRGITFPTSGGGSDVVLGYLTDPYGNPCIKGTFFTDKAQRLKQSFLMGLATGAASAYASSETSETTDANGDTTLSVTGDKLKYLAGVGVSQGTQKVVDQLEKEEFDIWETVVVPSGVRVAVHLDQTLALDQTSLQRKVVYVGTNNIQSFTD